MKKYNKIGVVLSLVTIVALAAFLYNPQDGVVTGKTVAAFILLLVSSKFDYYRGYQAGKKYYTEHNPDLPLRASQGWDHHKDLETVIKEHPFCLMELEHAPCIEHDYPLPAGRIHLLQNCKQHTTLSLLDDGWVYSADTNFTKEELASGKYKPMLTSDAIRISHDKFWDFYF